MTGFPLPPSYARSSSAVAGSVLAGLPVQAPLPGMLPGGRYYAPAAPAPYRSRGVIPVSAKPMPQIMPLPASYGSTPSRLAGTAHRRLSRVGASPSREPPHLHLFAACPILHSVPTATNGIASAISSAAAAPEVVAPTIVVRRHSVQGVFMLSIKAPLLARGCKLRRRRQNSHMLPQQPPPQTDKNQRAVNVIWDQYKRLSRQRITVSTQTSTSIRTTEYRHRQAEHCRKNRHSLKRRHHYLHSMPTAPIALSLPRLATIKHRADRCRMRTIRLQTERECSVATLRKAQETLPRILVYRKLLEAEGVQEGGSFALPTHAFKVEGQPSQMPPKTPEGQKSDQLRQQPQVPQTPFNKGPKYVPLASVDGGQNNAAPPKAGAGAGAGSQRPMDGQRRDLLPPAVPPMTNNTARARDAAKQLGQAEPGDVNIIVPNAGGPRKPGDLYPQAPTAARPSQLPPQSDKSMPAAQSRPFGAKEAQIVATIRQEQPPVVILLPQSRALAHHHKGRSHTVRHPYRCRRNQPASVLAIKTRTVPL